MRIVYMLNSLGPGGAERQVLALAERLTRRGHTVSLLILRPKSPKEWPTALPVVHLDMRKNPFSVVAAMVRARRYLIGFRPDILHSHSFHANILARLLRALIPSTTAISTVHNVYEGGFARMLAYRLTDAFALRTVAVSRAAADRYVRLNAVPKHKCSAMSNGIDTDEFASGAHRREVARSQMGATNQFIWLAAGRIVPAKDYATLLRAFAQLRPSRPDAELWIAGEGPAAHATSLRIKAAELGLNASVRWLGLRRDMPALLDATDAFVSSSAWEGMPLAIGEAMAMEKPVVATDVGGVRELVGNLATVVAPNAPDALARAMLDVMHCPADARQALGHTARDRIAKHFSMDAIADQWEALYREVLEPKA